FSFHAATSGRLLCRSTRGATLGGRNPHKLYLTSARSWLVRVSVMRRRRMAVGLLRTLISNPS
ncbi:hypothetical protein LINPERPRIM_LOCUS38776, partial [Linum perenne]